MPPHGFTLIELLVTIGVLITLALIALPSLHSTDPAQDAADLTAVSAALRLTRSTSATRGTALTLTAQGQRLTITAPQGGVDTSTLPAYTLGPNTAARGQVTVQPDGQASGALSVTQGGACRALSLSLYGDVLSGPCTPGTP